MIENKYIPTPYELFGVECGPGWKDIVNRLFEKVDEINRTADYPIHVIQVKEKYGELRFYVSHGTDDLYDAIDAAEEESWNTCEECGSKEDVVHTEGWIYTRCKKCLKKLELERGCAYTYYK